MTKRGAVMGAAALAGMGMLYGFYLRARQETIRKLREGSRIADTRHGPLEYAVTGSGLTVLVLHGASGGYEQALLLAKLIDPGKFSLIGLSRPGYRQTPLSTGQTPEQQADAAYELLESLDILKATVIGISAGGLTAMQLALRHPECCRGLILVSADMPPVENDQVSRLTLARLRILVSIPDFFLWVLFAPFRIGHLLIDSSSTGGKILISDPDAIAIAKEMIFSFWPQKDGRAGIMNDIEQILTLHPYPLEEIQIPTLIIHGTHDAVVPIGLAEHAARTIPDSQSLFISGGSHLVLATHSRQVGRRIQEFLDEG